MNHSLEKIRALFIGVLLALLALTASGCNLPDPRLGKSNQPRDLLFRPPTLVPTTIPTVTAPPVDKQQPTQPANCLDLLSFVSDVSVPDGTVFAPQASIDKRWEVENSGTCNWNSQYRLKLVAGPEMGVKPVLNLLPVRSGSRGVIRIQFKAPSEPGTYRSAWQAYNPNGQPFGDLVYIEIVVQTNAPTSTP